MRQGAGCTEAMGDIRREMETIFLMLLRLELKKVKSKEGGREVAVISRSCEVHAHVRG